MMGKSHCTWRMKQQKAEVFQTHKDNQHKIEIESNPQNTGQKFKHMDSCQKKIAAEPYSALEKSDSTLVTLLAIGQSSIVLHRESPQENTKGETE